MDHAKLKRAFQYAQMQIILRMRNIHSGPWVSSYTFCAIQRFC